MFYNFFMYIDSKSHIAILDGATFGGSSLGSLLVQLFTLLTQSKHFRIVESMAFFDVFPFEIGVNL